MKHILINRPDQVVYINPTDEIKRQNKVLKGVLSEIASEPLASDMPRDVIIRKYRTLQKMAQEALEATRDAKPHK